MKFTLDLAQIAELPTQIATSTALRLAEISGDDIFEMVIAVVTSFAPTQIQRPRSLNGRLPILLDGYRMRQRCGSIR